MGFRIYLELNWRKREGTERKTWELQWIWEESESRGWIVRSNVRLAAGRREMQCKCQESRTIPVRVEWGVMSQNESPISRSAEFSWSNESCAHTRSFACVPEALCGGPALRASFAYTPGTPLSNERASVRLAVFHSRVPLALRSTRLQSLVLHDLHARTFGQLDSNASAILWYLRKWFWCLEVK